MTARDRIPDFDDRLRRLALRFAADATVAAAYLYGSRARGDARPGSDVDIAVILSAKLSPAERCMYLDIDHGRLFDELGWIEDSEHFAVAVERWLARL